ncbi:MAG: NAD-dependent epimerase/dehydratase family protein [Gammaproteobacteria bacterium]
MKCIDANINGLRNLLDYSVAEAQAGRALKGFLFYSSSEIYGDPAADAIPTPETYRGNVSCTGPRACYDESKRFGETLCVTYAKHYGVPVRMARPVQQLRPGTQDHRRSSHS